VHHAPTLADTDAGYDRNAFAFLAAREAGHFWFEPRNRLLLGLAQRYFPRVARYLEIGCGTGFVLAAFARTLPYSCFTGAELHSSGLGVARDRLGNAAELVQMDARAIPARGALDLIGAFDVLEHIEEDEIVIGQVFAALTGGGGFLATVPQHRFLWSTADEAAHHVRRYRPGELEAKLRRSGFEILFSSSYNAAVHQDLAATLPVPSLALDG
jgi:SAM-dependent methyltransferase